jgi:carboxyl-terminal processing protease
MIGFLYKLHHPGYDPHTNYFAPEEKERFDVSIRKLEGIARLQKKNDFTEISELISGGPALRGKQLKQGRLSDESGSRKWTAC